MVDVAQDGNNGARMRKAAAFLAIVSLAGLGLIQAAPSDAAASLCMGRTPTKIGTAGNDVIFGTAGNDVILGGGGKDTIDGLAGDDYICGGKGVDKLYGNFGNDRLAGGGGGDILDGGPDWDVVSYQTATGSVSVSVVGNKGTMGGDKITTTENVVGSPYGDSMSTTNSLTSVSGGAGNDTLYSKNGGGMSGDGGSDRCYIWQYVYGLNKMNFLPAPSCS